VPIQINPPPLPPKLAKYLPGTPSAGQVLSELGGEGGRGGRTRQEKTINHKIRFFSALSAFTPARNLRNSNSNFLLLRLANTQRLNAETRDRTGDLQIFGLTLSQLSYRGYTSNVQVPPNPSAPLHPLLVPGSSEVGNMGRLRQCAQLEAATYYCSCLHGDTCMHATGPQRYTPTPAWNSLGLVV
jgi:hypothetical protein